MVVGAKIFSFPSAEFNAGTFRLQLTHLPTEFSTVPFSIKEGRSLGGPYTPGSR